MRSLKSKIFLSLLAVLVSAIFAGNGFAQIGMTGINGTITDQTDAVIPGAAIKIVNPANGFTRTITTGSDGRFNFASLLPATYLLEIEAANFKKAVKRDIEALIENPVSLNIILEIGSITATIDITSSDIESIVNTEDAALGNNFDRRQIQQLPTDSRNVNDLLSLQPGVTREGYVNGGRSDQANITLDGIDVNDQQLGEAFFSVLRATAESVEEFRVTTTNPNADRGRSSGAQISLLTKSGTNEFHGAGFWLPRRTFGSANNFFNNSADEPQPRPNIDRDVFGGAIGGPIIKNKLFFFYSYEGLRENIEIPVTRIVPLADFGQGILKFQETNGNIVTLTPAQFLGLYPAVGQNPAALAALASAASRYPANDSRIGDGLNTSGFRFNAPTSLDENTHVLKFDWNINDNQQFFIRGNKQQDVSRSVPAFLDTVSPENWDHNTGIALGHIWNISSNKINNFRYGLTRQSYTRGGDANENSISFAYVFLPLNFDYSLSRVTPVQNFADDFTWILGKHTLQFGGNIRIIRNKRSDSSPAYDRAVINPSFYQSSGQSLLTPLITAGYNISENDLFKQAAVAALIGRYSQYTANYNYDLDGSLLPSGSIIERTFATEEYDMYVQDSWKILRNLNVNLGLRYSLSRPVYEKNGYQVRPDIPLGEYFRRRLEGAAQGKPYNETLNFELAGPKNNAPGFYSLDTNNFQPRISAAWSPNFKKGFLGTLFGKDNESVFRGGFAVTNDYFGQQLAVTFNDLSTLGFLTSSTIGPNTYNVTDNLAPLFTGFGQNINVFPGVPPLSNRLETPADGNRRIEFSLDSDLVSPTNYNWSFTYGRKLPKGLYIEASYVGRKARNLLVQRDVATPNNLVDPRSGTDWYTAAGQIYDYYYSGTNVANIASIPYFENLFPQLANFFGPNTTATQSVYTFANIFRGDWTALQSVLNSGSNLGINAPNWKNFFFQPQYAAFTAFSTVGKSDYHGGNLSVRQRLGNDLIFDFNYTYSKSMDDASGLQTSQAYDTAFVLNPIRQSDSYTVSDFDTRHVINANGLWQLPFGKGRKYLSDLNSLADTFLGGWQLGGIFRWNSAKPVDNLRDLTGWATNWNVRSFAVRTNNIQSSPTRGGNGKPANLFSDLNQLKNSIRPPRPGETGDRNVFRGTSFSQLDMNLGKTFEMPWSENHKLQFRWEVFNILNSQYLDEGSLAFSGFFPANPANPESSPITTPRTGEFTSIKGVPRRMQFVLRYSF